MNQVDEIIRKYHLLSDQVESRELKVILSELESCLEASSGGSVVEFGCYVGTTSVFIRRLLNLHGKDMEFHVYDSFLGLPDKRVEDNSVLGEQFQVGELKATKKQFVYNFLSQGLKLPIIHKAWFSDLTPDDVPSGIVFAFLDGDYYQSIRDSLGLISSKLAKNFVIVVDDYTNPALPGARQAVNEWIEGKNLTVRTEASLAIISQPAA